MTFGKPLVTYLHLMYKKKKPQSYSTLFNLLSKAITDL